MTPGCEVEVRSSFDGRWVRGFEVVELEDRDLGAPAVWLRRRSDGTRLPVPFGAADVRAIGPVRAESRSA